MLFYCFSLHARDIESVEQVLLNTKHYIIHSA
jgi:hypothetical protein